MAPHPGINADNIREKARKDLLDLLESVPGRKNLVIEKALAGPVGILLKFSVLQEHGVDKVFFLENDNVDPSQKNIIFLASGEKAPSPIAISEQIKRLQSHSNTDHQFSVFLVPRRTLVCDKIFEDAGVLGDITIDIYPLHFIPLEQDILSLCLEDAFSDLYLEKDPTCIFTAAQALMPLQYTHGLFPRIIGKGYYAHRLMELLLRMRSEAAAEDTNTQQLGMMPSASIDSLIIIDRSIDFATPLLTQLTYEGLIDEHYGIKDNQAEIDSSIVGLPPGSKQLGREAPAQQSLQRKIQLDSSDKLYMQLRDTNFAIVDSLINKVARRLQADIESRHTAKTTSELRDFVKKLPGYQSEQASLKTHIGLTEDILKYTSSDLFRRVLEVQQNLADGTDPSSQHETIDELISRSIGLPTILRLICLESIISGGLRQKDLDNYKRLILHAYGYQHLLTLHNLEKMGLLSTRSSANVLLNPIGVGVGGGTSGSALTGGGSASSGAGGGPSSHLDGIKTNYNYVRKLLRLIVDEVNESNPNDISYVYSGYAPLSVRLVQAILQKQHLLSITRGANAAAASTANGTSPGGGGTGTASHGWQGFEDALRNIRGETFNKVQKGEEQAVKARHMLTGGGGGGNTTTATGSVRQKTVLVMFLGGITFTEIAALRFVARQLEAGAGAGAGGGAGAGAEGEPTTAAIPSKQGKKIVICTTGIISGETIMQGAIEKGDFGKG